MELIDQASGSVGEKLGLDEHRTSGKDSMYNSVALV